MEWLERMNRAMDYIELNLAGEIELSEVARRACRRLISSRGCSHSLLM